MKKEEWDNKHWELRCRLYWSKKPESPPSLLTCKNCDGYGEISSPFSMAMVECYLCKGTGTIKNEKLLPKPENVPTELYEAVKEAYLDYFEEKNCK